MNTNKQTGLRQRPKRLSRSEQISAMLIKAGTVRLLVLSAVLSLGLGAAWYYAYVLPRSNENEALRGDLMQKRRLNAIARMVQETKPDFLQQFRRVINNFTTARELLPSESEVSNVLDGIQQMARNNGVRVTMFDASKPSAKSSSATAATTNSPTQPAAQPNAQPAPADPSQPSQPQITLNERVMPAQIQGTHAAVARFLSDVAKYPRIIYVRDFSITSMQGRENVNLTLVTYDAPTSGVLPPIPDELRNELQQSQGKTAQNPQTPDRAKNYVTSNQTWK
jgi:Tfp pilus assembly protein PilO